MSKSIHSIFALLLLSLCLVTPAFAGPSPTVPLDSWVYPAMERLEALGVVDTALQGSRPWSRLEVARLVVAADGAEGDTAELPAVRELLARFHREFAAEIVERTEPPRKAVRYLHAIGEARLSYLYREGGQTHFPGTNAEDFPLDDNRSGRTATAGHNLEGSFSGAARYGIVLADWRPLVEYRQGEGADLRLLGGGVTLSLGPIDLFAGRQALCWGQGRQGTLVLSDNARPLDMLRLSTPEAKPLPWLFKYLGPFHFDLFASRLEKDRVVPEPWFGGMRLEIKPFPWFELGASRTSFFGGKGRPSVGVGDFIKVVVGSNPPAGSSDNANSIAALDARLRLAPLGGLELYGELGGEDEANHFFSKTAWIAGALLPRLDAAGRLSLRLEYADLAYRGNGPVWYRHGTYASGYTYQGRLLGYPAGGDSRDLYGELGWQYGPDLDLALSCGWQRRGVDGPVEERHLQPGIEARWRLRSRLEARLAYRYDHAQNYDHIAGNDRDLNWVFAELILRVHD